MQVAVRSRLNMGIALAGAGAIALAPIAQPMPAIAELQARAVSSAEVALSAAANPIEQWAQIIQDALANSGTLVQSYLNNPLPIVHQLILNGAGYVGQTVTALQTGFSNLVDSLRFDNPYGFPAGVQQGLSEILAGQIYDGYNTLFNAGLGLILGPVFPLLDLLQIPVTMAQNVANVVAAVPNALLFAGLGALGTINGTFQAAAFQVQAVVDALKTGDLLGAVGAIVAVPGAIVNAVLNGFPVSGAPGILSPGGIIDQVIQTLNSFAQAIAPTSTPLAAKVADTSPSAVPSASLSVATTTLGAEKVATPEESKAPATETTATEPKATEPTATTPTATTPTTTEPTATEPTETTPEKPSSSTETKPETKPESGTTANGGTDTTGGNKAEPGKTGEPTKPSDTSGGSTGTESGSTGSTGSDGAGSASGSGTSGSGTSGSGTSGSGASGAAA